jgi:hypothetical protein
MISQKILLVKIAGGIRRGLNYVLVIKLRRIVYQVLFVNTARADY